MEKPEEGDEYSPIEYTGYVFLDLIKNTIAEIEENQRPIKKDDIFYMFRKGLNAKNLSNLSGLTSAQLTSLYQSELTKPIRIASNKPRTYRPQDVAKILFLGAYIKVDPSNYKHHEVIEEYLYITWYETIKDPFLLYPDINIKVIDLINEFVKNIE